ncbi:MAG: hypothetical protein R3F39_12250 [Myxococcota bacterium]
MSSPTLHPHGPALLAGVITSLVAYVAGWLGMVPVLAYMPATGAFTFSPDPDLIAMSYYGLLLLGGVSFGVGYLATRAVTATRALTPGAARALSRVAAVIAVGALLAVAVVELGERSHDGDGDAAPRSENTVPASLPGAG